LGLTTMLMTVAEMAERAGVKPINRPPFVNKIRHWASTGLLKPVGEQRPGTGKPRLFNDAALEDALILNAMADYGIPIGVQETALILIRGAKKDWRSKIAQGERLVLEVAKLPDGQQVAHCYEGDARMAGGQAVSAISFDLGALFSVLRVPSAELALSDEVPGVKVT
jgi:DNA-binding transcriptional MerR regulator